MMKEDMLKTENGKAGVSEKRQRTKRRSEKEWQRKDPTDNVQRKRPRR